MTSDGSRFCSTHDDTWMDSYMGNLHSQWKPISLTYVTYPEGDIIGKVLAWSSLLPIFIIVAFITLIIFRREIHTMVFFLGILLNEVVNMAVKSYVKAPRPCRPGDEKLLYNKYGMPSSHAQFVGFFAIYMFCFAYIRLKTREAEKFMDNIRRHVIALSAIGAAVLVSCSRIYLYYHTLEQVFIGLIIGAVYGLLWFYVVEKLIMPYSQNLVNTKLAEFFLIRDSSSIPDILWFEYTASRSEARQRNKRAGSKSQ